jgi:SAM-dependent methyltransferase
MDAGDLASSADWDRYWKKAVANLPVIADRKNLSLQAQAILDVVDEYVVPAKPASVLEVGGAPGGYLAYIHRQTGCRCTIIDYSAHGCALARENFKLLGIPADVRHQDIFDEQLPEFDVVYSLGLIEHFDDPTELVRAHLAALRPGGTLLIGAPNFRGINGWFASRLDPSRLDTQNLDIESLAAWTGFEKELRLERMFLDYVGGFEPGVFAHFHDVRARHVPLAITARLLDLALGRRFRGLRRFNNPAISGYMIGVWHR